MPIQTLHVAVPEDRNCPRDDSTRARDLMSFQTLLPLTVSYSPRLSFQQTTMEFPVIRRERQSVRERPSTNGTNTPNGEIDRRPHTQDKDLPGGANWVVQKFGGTSVGKFAVKIAEDIVV